MAKQLLCGVVAAACLATPTTAAIPSVPIAPGVNLPVVSLGTGSGQHGDVANATALWIQAGGVGIDTAYDYMDEGDVAKGIAAANATAADVYVVVQCDVCVHVISCVVLCQTHKKATMWRKALVNAACSRTLDCWHACL